MTLSPALTAHSNKELKNFLCFFANKIQYFRANITHPSSFLAACLNHPCVFESFALISLNALINLDDKMKPSCCPLDILPTPLLGSVFSG